VIHAFIDEAGQRAATTESSDHFIMSAVLVHDDHRASATKLLADLRREIGRQPTDVLHWRNIKNHGQRIHVAQRIGGSQFLTLSTVVVLKRQFPAGSRLKDEDVAYLYTLRFLLERLSWLARDSNAMLEYTLAMVKGFPLQKLREYEQRLVGMDDCQIAWTFVPKGGAIDQPSRLEELQLADMVASATYLAFEPDNFGNTERRYLNEIAPRLYRRFPGRLTSYGLKMHPWSAQTRAVYQWVDAL
jgi:hypothetical protein